MTPDISTGITGVPSVIPVESPQHGLKNRVDDKKDFQNKKQKPKSKIKSKTSKTSNGSEPIGQDDDDHVIDCLV